MNIIGVFQFLLVGIFRRPKCHRTAQKKASIGMHHTLKEKLFLYIYSSIMNSFNSCSTKSQFFKVTHIENRGWSKRNRRNKNSIILKVWTIARCSFYINV